MMAFKKVNYAFQISAFFLLLLISFNLFAQEEEPPIWPKDLIAGDYTITLYQPENASYIDAKLKSNLAFSVKKEGEEPKFGMLWTTSILDVDRASRVASLASVKIDEVRLTDEVSEEQKEKFQNLVNSEVRKWSIEFPLDELLESLEEVSTNTSDLKNAPPVILFAKEPTALILIDGEPKLKAARKGYELVENTGALIIKKTKSGDFYLKGGDFWYVSKSALGPWENTKKVPSKVKKIAKKAAPEKKEDEEKTEDYNGKAPTIKVVTEPSELVVFQGEPEYKPLQGTNLLYVENTESDIFMHISNQTYYLLLSGRWFSTQDIKGNWTYLASENLPEDFLKISGDSKKANVLSSVAGTKEAKDAIYDAQIPQTAAVNRDTKASTVSYNGTPEFKNVEGLKLQYAVNTESAVFKDKNNYYLCDNAIWFISNTPNGPWRVADDRPEEIDKIPSENPRYNTKYVYIYETSPTVVYVGYTPGYYGSYVYGPTVVYGTGYYYNPWYNGYYYHYHYSYGFSVRYNPWYGWSFGFGYGSPYYWYGYSYWGYGHHHWGPPYYRPPYYRRGYYHRPYHPIYNGRRGVSHYNRPVTRPNTRPGGARPSTRPSNRPATKPSTRPNVRPSNKPTTRPNVRPSNKPTTRPNVSPGNKPVTRPANKPAYKPNTRPSTNQMRPSSRPAPRPSSRPAARPSTNRASRPSGGRRRN